MLAEHAVSRHVLRHLVCIMVYRAASPDRVSTVSTWEPVRDTASEAPEVSSQAAEVDSVKGEVTAETSQAAPAVSTASASAQLESSHGSRGSQQATGIVRRIL